MISNSFVTGDVGLDLGDSGDVPIDPDYGDRHDCSGAIPNDTADCRDPVKAWAHSRIGQSVLIQDRFSKSDILAYDICALLFVWFRLHPFQNIGARRAVFFLYILQVFISKEIFRNAVKIFDIRKACQAQKV